MCNDYGNTVGYREYVEAFSHIRLPLIRPGPAAAPNLEPKDEIWPTDPAPVIRRIDGGVELLAMRWGWTPPKPKARAVINLRGEGRAFASGRILVPASHYYEFTEPPPGEDGRKSRVKARWRFTRCDGSWFCFPAIVGRGEGPDGEPIEAFALVTAAPGPDVAPYHDRQPVVLGRDAWAAWLDSTRPAAELLLPSPAGSLRVEAAPRADAAGPPPAKRGTKDAPADRLL